MGFPSGASLGVPKPTLDAIPHKSKKKKPAAAPQAPSLQGLKQASGVGKPPMPTC